MSQFSLTDFWARRLAGSNNPAVSQGEGWIARATDHPGFVEPNLVVREGDPETARIIIVSAPGAVGKSAYASALSARTSSALVDLSRTGVLGTNFFVGGLVTAFGIEDVIRVKNGNLALVVDALDEGQVRSGTAGFVAALQDLRNILSPAALPVTLLGRAASAEHAWLILDEAGLDTCLVSIDYFDEEKAREYLRNKLPITAALRASTRAAFAKRPGEFTDFALRTRETLQTTSAGEVKNFAGYAPVLDAVISYVLDEESLNPSSRLAAMSHARPVDLLDSICLAILEREQNKFTDALDRAGGIPQGFALGALYSPDEQLARVCATLTGADNPTTQTLPNAQFRQRYEEMIADFAPQHPFLVGSEAANVAFAAYVLAWALHRSEYEEHARLTLRVTPKFVTGVLFDLYLRRLTQESVEAGAIVPLADVGILHAALTSNTGPGQRTVMELTEEDQGRNVYFELTSAQTSVQEAVASKNLGSFPTSGETVNFDFPISDVYIHADISVSVGDGTSATIYAPTFVDIKELRVDGGLIVVNPSAAKKNDENMNFVALVAERADVASVRGIEVRDVDLGVSFPRSRIYPWTDYAIEVPAAPNPEVEHLRRILRRVLTAFRSHSKGALVRLAAKIDHERMMKKGEMGPKLVSRLLADGVLEMIQVGVFYKLNQDRMGELLNMNYHAIQQQRWTEAANNYLNTIARANN